MVLEVQALPHGRGIGLVLLDGMQVTRGNTPRYSGFTFDIASMHVVPVPVRGAAVRPILIAIGQDIAMGILDDPCLSRSLLACPLVAAGHALPMVCMLQDIVRFTFRARSLTHKVFYFRTARARFAISLYTKAAAVSFRKPARDGISWQE